MPGKKLRDEWTHPSPAVSAAYKVCLHVEKELMGQKTPNLTKAGAGTLEKKLVNIRILGHLLVIGPTDTAREHVGRMVLADVGGGFDEIINRGWFYDKFFLRSFRKAKTSTTQGSPDLPPFGSTLADVANTVERRPFNHTEARKSALVRDDHRCMVTGALDSRSLIEFRELWKPGTTVEITQCTHIFAEPTNDGVEDEQKEHAEHALAIIRAFGCEDACNELGGPNGSVHRLENVMTLTAVVQDFFDRLEMWFEATDTPNSYKVRSSFPDFHAEIGIPEDVVFTTASGLPLPSPRYLEIHAACCQVAHMSGAADYYHYLDDDYPLVTNLRSSYPVGFDLSAVLQARHLGLSEMGAVVTVSG